MDTAASLQFVTSAAPLSERPDVELKSTYVKSHLTNGKEMIRRRATASISKVERMLVVRQNDCRSKLNEMRDCKVGCLWRDRI